MSDGVVGDAVVGDAMRTIEKLACHSERQRRTCCFSAAHEKQKLKLGMTNIKGCPSCLA
jgi:hypothetical protein